MFSLLPTLAVHRPGHIAVVVAFALIMSAWCRHGRSLKRRDPARELRHRRAAGYALLALSTVMALWYLLPDNFDVNWSFPLHICDLGGFIGPLALITRRRFFRVLLYFWGFGLTTQGFIQPIIEQGPDHIRFYLFWLNHSIVLAAAIYDVAVGGYKPQPVHLGATIFGTLVYAWLIFAFNQLVGANYLFIGPGKPGESTVIDVLGRYPQRVVFIFALAVAAMAIAYLPWPIARQIAAVRAERRDNPAA